MHSKKISISTAPFQSVYGDKEALTIAKRLGVDAVDFNTDASNGIYNDVGTEDSVYSLGEDAVIAYYRDLRAHADALGLRICMTHGRGIAITGIPRYDDVLYTNARYDLLAASILGADVCVMHTVNTFAQGKDCPPERMHELNLSLFTNMLSLAAEYNVPVATETFGDAPGLGVCDFFGNIDEFVCGYEAVCAASPHAALFKTCVDTGHSNKATRYGNPTPADVIRRLGTRTVCLHLHDNDTFTDQHKIPGTGCIDWEDVLCALDEVGYDGYYNMECALNYYGDDFLIECGAFAVKAMRQLIKNHEGKKQK